VRAGHATCSPPLPSLTGVPSPPSSSPASASVAARRVLCQSSKFSVRLLGMCPRLCCSSDGAGGGAVSAGRQGGVWCALSVDMRDGGSGGDSEGAEMMCCCGGDGAGGAGGRCIG
jgi:hypothetical protein